MRHHTISLWIISGIFLVAGLFYAEIAFGDQYPYRSHRAPSYRSEGGTFVFNPRTHQYHAISSSGRVVKQGRASGGRSYCPDIKRSCRTPSGVYRVTHKGGPGCHSSRYPVGRGGAPMPYCMFFSKYYAVHGSYDVPNHNASHGCIRVQPSDASWLHRNFMRVGTRVVVKPY